MPNEADKIGEIVEREWIDTLGFHCYEARIMYPNGLSVSQVVIKSPVTGWPIERQLAAENVRRAAITN